MAQWWSDYLDQLRAGADVIPKARYSKHYRVTKEELEWLGAQVEELGRVVHEVCS